MGQGFINRLLRSDFSPQKPTNLMIGKYTTGCLSCYGHTRAEDEDNRMAAWLKKLMDPDNYFPNSL
jgi:hypothetical protein